jgi:hypothetical protein
VDDTDVANELPTRIPLTTVPYSFQAQVANSVDGSNVGTGINATNITTGTLVGTLVGTGVSATNITTGTLSGSLVGTGVNATNITTGTLGGAFVGTGIDGGNINDGTIPTAKISGTIALVDGGTGATTAANARTNLGLAVNSDIQAYNAGLSSISSLSPAADGMLYSTGIDTYALTALTPTGRSILDDTSIGAVQATLGLVPGTDVHAINTHLTDLADGSLTGSKVGTGINATNVTIGTLPNGVLDANLQDLADGSLTGSKVGTGISATNVTTGTLPNSVLDADLQDLADGTLSGSTIGTGISATNLTTGTIPDARLESTVDVTRLNTTGGIHVGGTVDPGVDNLDVDGFTQLGTSGISVDVGSVSHPAIKVLVINGTTETMQGLTEIVTLTGMTDTKIISINVLVDYLSGDFVGPQFTGIAGYQFSFRYQNGTLLITNSASNSSQITSKPFKATIIYID